MQCALSFGKSDDDDVDDDDDDDEVDDNDNDRQVFENQAGVEVDGDDCALNDNELRLYTWI